ncbi:minor histocompatibility antigen H13-like isoform X2 [Rhopilema esculentum]|uniref:minor histocompatibility antigen H13-like isoform X2 n=1 Tax=Rhopilema esculentum TaxID=499914 RepID=UPI0031D10A49|eukprot:gene7788-13639_t
MADADLVSQTLNDTVNATLNNATAQNRTAMGRAAATPQGLLVAYCSLVLMALIPIFFGSFRSIGHKKRQKESGEKIESMSKKDAAMFPIIASCTLFGLYIFFKIFGKEYINHLLALYFFVLGVMCLANILRPILNLVTPDSFPRSDYHIMLTEGQPPEQTEYLNFKFDRVDLICLAISSIIGLWYLVKKHWIANNVFGLAFSLSGVELLHLNSFPIGCILLGGLFVYDIFWVFGTDVMVTVAKSFDGPIKLVFPMDFLEHGIYGKNFAMLGLGDIVIPGIFIALLLRYDCSKQDGNRKPFFFTSFLAYFLGLVMTVVVMHFFKAAQPALLYLVPACIGSAIIVAIFKGEVSDLFKYEDHPEEMIKKDDESCSKKAEVEEDSTDEAKKEK